VLACSGVRADTGDLEYAWRTWMKEQESAGSTLAIIQDGTLVGTWGHRMEADTVLPLASLSKAITGACVMALIDEAVVQLDTPMANIFGNRPDLLPGYAREAGRITVAQLLTHTSGLVDDPSQRLFYPAWWGGYDGPDPVTAQALSLPIGGHGHFYNNLNYAILGSMIAERTGESPAVACGRRVLEGLDTAAPSEIYGGTLSYAGWAMSAADYTRFADGLRVRPDWPRVNVHDGVEYGPGVEIEDWGRGQIIHHSGSYCLIGTRTTGSFFAKLPNGITFTLVHDLCLGGDRFWDMFDVLIEAGLR